GPRTVWSARPRSRRSSRRRCARASCASSGWRTDREGGAMTQPVGLLLGLDLTEVGRVAEVLERHGERFLARVFREGEIRRTRRHPRAFAEHVAGRFAAKEAA